MRTVIQAIDAFPSLVSSLFVPFLFHFSLFFPKIILILYTWFHAFVLSQVDFVMEILSKLVRKQVWILQSILRISMFVFFCHTVLFEVDESVVISLGNDGQLIFYI